MWRTMFSSMTMASSTTKPTDSVSASSVMLLIEKPNAYIAAQVPTSEIGTASAGMMVADTERRNRKITRTTSAIGDQQRLLHVDHRLRIEIERSLSTFHADRRRDLRAQARQLRGRNRPPRPYWRPAGAGWRARSARSSLNQLAILSFSTLSMTRAISSSLTGAPLR